VKVLQLGQPCQETGDVRGGLIADGVVANSE